MSDYELEILYEIWNNKDGMHMEIGPDRDGLDLIEIRQFDDNEPNSKVIRRISFSHEEAELLITALQKLVKEIK